MKYNPQIKEAMDLAADASMNLPPNDVSSLPVTPEMIAHVKTKLEARAAACEHPTEEMESVASIMEVIEKSSLVGEVFARLEVSATRATLTPEGSALMHLSRLLTETGHKNVNNKMSDFRNVGKNASIEQFGGDEIARSRLRGMGIDPARLGLKDDQSGSEVSRGSKRTEPKPRAGGWSDA